MTKITLENITKRFGTETAIDDISLTVADGEVLSVVGPSGCGKSTTLRTIAGFESPTDGRVRFDGEDVTNVRPDDRNVGLVFQDYALFKNMSVIENVTFGPRMDGVSKPERTERADRLLEMLDIASLRDRDPATLSGGQKQRVGLARALAIEPRVLLLDEPMTGLDAKLKRQLRSEIGGLLADLGVTCVYVTHDQAEAMSMGDRIAVFNDGTLEQIGTAREVYERPANRFVADFVGTSNTLPVTVRDNVLDLGFTRVAANGHAPTDDGLAVVRPEDFTVGRGSINATVSDAFYLGARVQLIVELPNEERVTVTMDRTTDEFDHGETVSIGVDADGVHVIGE